MDIRECDLTGELTCDGTKKCEACPRWQDTHASAIDCTLTYEDGSPGGFTNRPQMYTLSCGCKSEFSGFPSVWKGTTRENLPCLNYGVLCLKHYSEWDAWPDAGHSNPEAS